MNRPAARILLGMLGVAAALIVVITLPQFLISGDSLTRSEELKAENDLRLGLAQVGGGAFLALGVILTAREIQLNRERNEGEHFVQAIELLTSNEPAVVLGGVHALGQLGKRNNVLRVPVYEVLTAHLLSHASPGTPDEPLSPPSPDVLGALFMVGDWRFQGARRLSLDGIDLSYRLLGRIRLPGANLWRARFVGSNLHGAHLEGANLQSADLRGANLSKAHMKGAVLNAAKIDGANFSQTDLRNAKLEGVDLSLARGKPIQSD